VSTVEAKRSLWGEQSVVGVCALLPDLLRTCLVSFNGPLYWRVSALRSVGEALTVPGNSALLKMKVRRAIA
jgi:hypothetical protein